jgi:hypothetical protein
MNLSQGEYFQKYPYIITLRKYWLEYGGDQDIPEYKEILSEQQIKSLYNVIKKNTFFKDYITGNKWDQNIIEKNYISDIFNEKNHEDKDQKMDPFKEEEIKEIFLKLADSKNKKKNINEYLMESNKDLPLYRLFYSFANLSWVTSDQIKNNINNSQNYLLQTIPLIVSPDFYNPSFNYNDFWKYQSSNSTPSNIQLLVQKELNFLLMEQDNKRFRKEESGLDSSKQLEYLKSESLGNKKQEIYSYIKHADLSQYDQSGKLPTFNPKPYVPKVKGNFRPTIPYDKKIYGISSSNLLTLQIVEAISSGNNYTPSNNLTNTDIIMQMKEKQNIIGISSNQKNGYSSPPDGQQIPVIIDGKSQNINPRLYNQVSLKRIY